MPDIAKPTTIAFIGAGTMGAPMVRHLLDAGHAVRLYARRPDRIETLLDAGATLHDSPAIAAHGAEFVFTNVTQTADVEQVLLGRNGVIESAAPGTLCIDHSTISPDGARRIAAALEAQGLAFLDAPVSGGAMGAQAATLSIMVGGHAHDLARARPLLEKLGTTITHVGAHGAGQIAKVCNQLVLVVNIQGIAEAMLFAQRHGADLAQVLQAISAGLAGSKALDLMGTKMACRDFSAGIEARLHDKDFAMIRDTARAAGLHLPALEATAEQLHALVENGWGSDDTSSLLRVIERQNQATA